MYQTDFYLYFNQGFLTVELCHCEIIFSICPWNIQLIASSKHNAQ